MPRAHAANKLFDLGFNVGILIFRANVIFITLNKNPHYFSQDRVDKNI